MTSAELVWRNAKTNFNGKVVKGMNEKFLEVGDVMQILGISRSAAYKLMRQINSELEKKLSEKDMDILKAVLTEELLEAIRILNDAQDQDYAQKCHIEQMVKLSEYELQKIYFEVIKELTKEEHLLDMVIPMCVEKDLINKD